MGFLDFFKNKKGLAFPEIDQQKIWKKYGLQILICNDFESLDSNHYINGIIPDTRTDKIEHDLIVEFLHSEHHNSKITTFAIFPTYPTAKKICDFLIEKPYSMEKVSLFDTVTKETLKLVIESENLIISTPKLLESLEDIPDQSLIFCDREATEIQKEIKLKDLQNFIENWNEFTTKEKNELKGKREYFSDYIKACAQSNVEILSEIKKSPNEFLAKSEEHSYKEILQYHLKDLINPADERSREHFTFFLNNIKEKWKNFLNQKYGDSSEKFKDVFYLMHNSVLATRFDSELPICVFKDEDKHFLGYSRLYAFREHGWDFLTVELTGVPIGVWIRMKMPNHPYFIGFTYLDPEMGPSAAGNPSKEERVIVMLTPDLEWPWEIIEKSEVEARKLPNPPSWLEHCGPQPEPGTIWRE